jgi:hypothetical protein
MEASRFPCVRVDVAENLIELTWVERETLLQRLHDVGGSESIIERFWAVGASWPVELNEWQQSRLRVTLERWAGSFLHDGLARLLVALLHADQGSRQ